MTQSLIECALTGQPTGPAIYSLHLARRTTLSAENSCGRKSGHLVQPRQCHSQPRRNRSGENPVLCCNLPYSSYHSRRKNSSGGKLVRRKVRSSSSTAPQSTAVELILGKPHTVLQTYMAPTTYGIPFICRNSVLIVVSISLA